MNSPHRPARAANASLSLEPIPPRPHRLARFLPLALLTFHFSLLTFPNPLPAASPPPPYLLNYQGRILVSGAPYAGPGLFRFALVSADGTQTYWSNDGTSIAGSQPVNPISLTVTGGAASVLLGDASIQYMTVIPPVAFTNHADVHLRVWFSDGTSNGSQLLTPDQRVASVGYAFLASTVPDGAISSAKIAPNTITGANVAIGGLTGANVANNSITNNQLAAGTAAANLATAGQSGVASGGIIMSREPNSAALTAAGYVRIGQLDEVPDRWTNLIINDIPAARFGATAVWTGAEMIVWGGTLTVEYSTIYGDGSRYRPATDSWIKVSPVFAPSPRVYHTAVWTGSQMIVWGGLGPGLVNPVNGGRYSPASDSWSPMKTTGAPLPRDLHTAVWAESRGEMIIWGGVDRSVGGLQVSTGGRYRPGDDIWLPVTELGAPTPRQYFTSVWTDPKMIVWGGFAVGGFDNTGGRYDPENDSWTATSQINAPSGRNAHTALAYNSEMIVWGGNNPSPLNDGFRYSPVTDEWQPLVASELPAARYFHAAVLAGSEMLIFGGVGASGPVGSGARFDLVQGGWIALPDNGAPDPRLLHTAVWTGVEMLVWGGASNGGATQTLNSGGRYHLGANTWLPLGKANVPNPRFYHTMTWTGSEAVVWGGTTAHGSQEGLRDGARYQPSTNTWVPVASLNAPPPCYSHTAVWTGSEVLIWGGFHQGRVQTGGRYNPVSNSWLEIPLEGAPGARSGHTAVWAGGEMIVWGGDGATPYLNDGGRYNPASGVAGEWITLAAAPTDLRGRVRHTAVSTGDEMIIFAGRSEFGGIESNGARYSPATNLWRMLPASTGAPTRREVHTAVWTGTDMIVWGGGNNTGAVEDGARYSLSGDYWAPISTVGQPTPRSSQSAVWTGKEMLIWGGIVSAPFLTGGRYNLADDTWVAMTTTSAAAARLNHRVVWTGTNMLVFGGDDLSLPVNNAIYSYTPPIRLFLYAHP